MDLKGTGILSKVTVVSLFVIAILASILLPEFLYAADSGQANPPHAFLGSATVEGEPAPPGTIVEAVIDGSVVATTEVGADGTYTLLVEGANPGDTVEFTVAGQPASASGVFEVGGVSRLDLDGSGSPQTGTATPIPSEATPSSPTAVPAPANTPLPPTAVPAPANTPLPPTAVPAPANTPLPPTPVPAQFDSVQSAFRVGPTLRLRPVNDVIDQNTDGLVEILFRNPVLNDNVMVVDLTVSIPSGIHLYGEGFATDTAGGAASGSFRTPPGQSRTIYVSIKSEQTGRFTIHFSGVYWPEGNKDLFNPVSLTHPFVVNAQSPKPLNPTPTNPDQVPAPVAPNPIAAPASTQEQQGSPGASCSLSPERKGIEGVGDTALLALPLFGLAGLVSWRRNRNRP